MLLPLELQKEAAQKALDDFTRKAKADFATVAGSSNKVNDSLEQMAASTKKIEFGQALDRGLSKFGDLKDIVEKAGASVFGLSEEMAVAAGASLDMSQKVASLGSLFGPLGVGIGAVVGGVIGYVSATKDSTAATEDATASLKAYNDQLKIEQILTASATDIKKTYAKLIASTSGDEFGIFGKSKDKLVDDFLDIGDGLKTLRAEAEQSAATFEALGATNKDVADNEKAYQADLAERIADLTRKKVAYQNAIDDLTPKQKAGTSATRDNVAAIEAETRAMMERLTLNSATTLDNGGADDIDETAAKLKAQFAEMARIDQLLAATPAAYQRAAEGVDVFASSVQGSTEILIEQGLAIESFLAGKAGDAINAFYDNVANREKLSADDRKRRRVEYLRDMGSFLVDDGAKHILAGSAKLAGGDILGGSEIGAGLAEVGAGLSVGGVGAIGQRRLGGTAGNDGASGGGTNGGPSDSRISDPGTQNLTPIVIEFKTTVPMTERQQQEAAQNIEGFLKKLRR